MGSLELDSDETDVDAVSLLLPTMRSDACFLIMLSQITASLDVWNACRSSWPTFSSSLVKGKCQDSCQVMEEGMQVRLRLDCTVLILKA